MRVSVLNILILAGGLQLLLADPGSGQGLEGTEITMELRNEPLISAFQKIEQQTDFLFAYREEQINGYRVTLDWATHSLKEVLDTMLAGTRLEYEVTENKIIVKRNLSAVPVSRITEWVPVPTSLRGTITGRVIDAQTGEPLLAANVAVLGTPFGTSTDKNGEYRIEYVPEGNHTVRASYIGYKTVKKQITIQGNEVTTINLSLEPETGRLDEMVVVGYGETQRRDLTGSVGTVTSEEIQEMNVQTIDEALKGTMSGVFVKSQSGRPGDGAIVHVRGLSQLRGSNEPLYVVDGVPIVKHPNGFEGTDMNPLVGINPDNIKRIDVLKDASAAAIYGSRAANGVVLITTKDGRNDSATNVDFSMSTSIQNPVKTYDMLSAEEYKDHTTRIAQYLLDSSPLPPSLNQPYFDIVNNPNQFFGNAETDWQDLITNDNALLTEYRATISGGSQDVSYRVSGQMSEQEGLMIGNNFKRYSLSPRIDANITDRLSAGASLNYNYIVDQSSAITSLSNGAFFRPDLPVRRDDRSFTTVPASRFTSLEVRNPIGGDAKVSNEFLTSNAYGSAFAEFEIINNLSIKSRVSLNLSNVDVSNFAPSFSDQVIEQAAFGITATPEAMRTVSTNRVISTVFSNTLNYSGTFAEKHNIDAVLGVSWDRSSYDSESQTYRGFPDDTELTGISSADRLDTFSSDISESGLNSFFGRVNYNFDDRYLLTFTVRRDGSTKFGPNNRYGIFPSGAIAWNLHNERFMQNIDAISQLKLRASFGQTGSDNLPSFSFLQYVDTGFFYGNNNGFTLTDFPNPDIKWEETTQLDVGLEFGLFNDRVNGEIVYFEKNTSDIILFTPLPSETGFNRYQTNLADVSNYGLEIQLGGYVIRNTNFAWNTSVNLSFVNNNVDDLAGGSSFSSADATPNIQEGSSIGIITGYEVVGIAQDQEEIDELNGGAPDGQYNSGLQQPGDYIYKDLDGDGQITAEDQKVLGDINPDYFGGLRNSLLYKDFEFSFAFNFVQGNQREWSPVNALGRANDVYSNATTLIEETWSPNNRDVEYARFNSGTNFDTNSRNVQDGSYIRFRSASLGYNLPQEWISSVGLRDAKVTLRGTNLLTFSDYEGIDPEAANTPRGGSTVDLTLDQGNFYPMARTFTLELNLGF